MLINNIKITRESEIFIEIHMSLYNPHNYTTYQQHDIIGFH
jgi:hypothetical protein